MTDNIAAALEKEAELKKLLAGYGSLVLAYSGGVDSTYLADVAYEVLHDKLRLVIANSPSIPRSELEEAKALAAEKGWPLDIIETREFDNPEFLKNNRNRCYVCKGELFARMRQYIEEECGGAGGGGGAGGSGGVALPRDRGAVLAYGETADDLADVTRVGKIAAKENGVVAPLLDAGMKKDDIRALSRRRNLPTWNKASFACLSSRFPTGRPLTLDEMARVERAEEVLKKYGFRQYRARHHGDTCRIEVEPGEFDKILDANIRPALVEAIKQAGYRYVTLDLTGYKTGGSV